MKPELTVIVAAAVGALAAILGSAIPTWIKVRADRQAQDRERLERRRDNLVRLEEKWIERDIEKVENAADALSAVLREINHLGKIEQAFKAMQAKQQANIEEAKPKLEQIVDELGQAMKAMRHALAEGSRRAFSLGPKVRTAFMNFDSVVNRLHQAMLGMNQESQPELWRELADCGGTLQEVLRDHLLSIGRDGGNV